MSDFDTYNADDYCEHMANAVQNHSNAEMQDAVEHLDDHNTNGETDIDRDILRGLSKLGQAIIDAQLLS